MLRNRKYKQAIIKLINENDELQRFKGKSVLITGGTGLIGSCLVDTFMCMNEENLMNVQVYVMCRNEEKAWKRFEMFRGNEQFHLLVQDVLEPITEEKRFDYVIHAASGSDPLSFAKYPVEVMKANIIGNINLLEHCKLFGTDKFVFISSGETYGKMEVGEDGFHEDMMGITMLNTARACYPESKRAGEVLCKSYHEEYGVPTVNARLSHVYGPTITDTNSRADAQFLRCVMEGKDIVLKSKGEQVRSYCYLFDAVSGLLVLLLAGKSGECYNVSNDNSVVSICDFAQKLAVYGNVNLKFDLPSDIEKKGFSNIEKAILNPGKLKSLGWVPKYTADEGIVNMLEIVREKGYEK